MNPILFKESNAKLNDPGQIFSTDAAFIKPLNIWTDGKQCVSCWKMSWKERILALFIGKVWLTVMTGKSQPYVDLYITNKFFYGVVKSSEHDFNSDK